MKSLTEQVRSPVRPLVDLASPLDVTRPAIYQAAHRGYIGGVIQVGTLMKISHEAYEYHARNGYGKSVPPYGKHIGLEDAAPNTAA